MRRRSPSSPTGRLINVGTGITSNLQAMAGHTKIALFNSLLFLSLSIVLDLVLIPSLGLVGAAIANSTAVVAVTGAERGRPQTLEATAALCASRRPRCHASCSARPSLSGVRGDHPSREAAASMRPSVLSTSPG
jgi:hypothetical protein